MINLDGTKELTTRNTTIWHSHPSTERERENERESTTRVISATQLGKEARILYDNFTLVATAIHFQSS